LALSYPYSPECVGGKFSELRVEGVLRSSVKLTVKDAPEFTVYYHG
jgi:hypothetical protein